MEKQLALWRYDALRAAADRLQAQMLASRKQPDLGSALAAKALLDLAPPRSARG